MKRIVLILLSLTTMAEMTAQKIISGIVTDGKNPLVGANVFIHGTLDGCITDSLGTFKFITDKKEKAELHVTYIGYDDFIMNIEETSQSISISMVEKASSIDEIVVTASSFLFGKFEDMKSMNALDVVLSGNLAVTYMPHYRRSPVYKK